MFRLRVVQAEHGDCLILEYGTASHPRYILVDGGPDTVYPQHLRGELLAIAAAGGKLDVAILSHVDDDHIVGLLGLLAEMDQRRSAGKSGPIAVDKIWHNTFSQTLSPEVERRFAMVMRAVGTPRGAKSRSAVAQRSISQGDELTRQAHDVDIPINPGFAPDRLVCADDAPDSLGDLANLAIRLVGPTRKSLAKLEKQWLAWLKEHEARLRVARGPAAASAALKADQSVPNLSSIMLLAEADGKTILLTGDGRWDHLLQGLRQAKLLAPGGTLHVNILKMPHHGSRRNVTRRFLQTVTADTYLISANGRDGNPDPETLQWIVEAAKEEERAIEIVVTNETDSTRDLLEGYKPSEYGYTLKALEPGKHAMVLELAG